MQECRFFYFAVHKTWTIKREPHNRIMSKLKLDNPFVVTGYFGPEYFCDREEETGSLISALSNGWNVSLISLEGWGRLDLSCMPSTKIRSYIQFMPYVRFIFAGSRLKMMQEMFLSCQPPAGVQRPQAGICRLRPLHGPVAGKVEILLEQ